MIFSLTIAYTSIFLAFELIIEVVKENRFRGSPRLESCSKRNVVGRLGRRRGGSVPISEQAELLRYDFGLVAGAAAVFRLVLTSGQSAFNVDLAPLGKQALAVVREPSEGDYTMPFGALLLLAVAILESGRGCD